MRALIDLDKSWVDIKGYEGLYKVHPSGVVKSLDRMIKYAPSTRYPFGKSVFHKGRIIKSWTTYKGYCQVHLRNHSKCRMAYSMHRLVALTFLPNLEGLPEVNHKDLNKSNNKVSNLEWCTSSYNSIHYLENIKG